MNFLLEIGTEEIPHWMVRRGVDQLKEGVENLFLQNEFVQPNVKAEATPRRLVVSASNLPIERAGSVQLVSGPPVSAGPKALAGFLAKQGGTEADLGVDNAGNRYLFSKHIPGRPTRDILADNLPAIVLQIHWPKTMYWTGGKTGPRFIRPIRWIVALLDDQPTGFEIAGVKSGNITRGHRILGSPSISVTFSTYESELRKNFVILSADERRQKIVTEISQLGAKLDADLIETLTFVTEYPTAIRGDFDPAFLELPAEVLTTVMRYHQKYFSVESAAGKLAPHFVAVMNTSGDPEGLVKRGNERVLKARFNDARFFWDVDQHKKLADRRSDLAHVTFHAKLGNYEDKSNRIEDFVRLLGGNDHARRAALLCKCDLTTEMVKEFTDLQGQVGGLYARYQGEPEPVAQAIYDHYKPLSMEDSIPSTPEGQIVALADKHDTLLRCFSIGMVPTGSKDPFALRRAAQGVVKILVEGKLNYNLNDLAKGELREFYLDRIKYYFREIRGFKYDEVNAVERSGWKTLPEFEDRLIALSAVRPTENFEPLAASFKRIQNILKQADHHEGQPIAETDFPEGAERQLYRELMRVIEVVKNAREYRPILEAIASTRPTVDKFFDQVMVMDTDPDVRGRRLELLTRISKQFSTIADFSEIVTSGDHK